MVITAFLMKTKNLCALCVFVVLFFSLSQNLIFAKLRLSLPVSYLAGRARTTAGIYSLPLLLPGFGENPRVLKLNDLI